MVSDFIVYAVLMYVYTKGARSSNQSNNQSYTHYLFNVQCSGHEKQFLECNHETLSNSNCQTTVTVYCQRCELYLIIYNDDNVIKNDMMLIPSVIKSF